MSEQLLRQYRETGEAVRRAALAAGRDPADVRLLAVSKTFPESDLEVLYRAGCRAFGENRVAELERKAAALPPDIQWHLIGQLQANKVRKAVRVAAFIHSVDSPALIKRIDRIAGEEKRCPHLLLEVNISGEASKSGLSPEAVPAAAAAAAAMRHADFCGLMTVAPCGAPEAELRRIFGELAALRDRLARACGRPLPELSMGMSGDYPAAIAAGATLVRIGSLIFGNRNYGGGGGQ